MHLMCVWGGWVCMGVHLVCVWGYVCMGVHIVCVGGWVCMGVHLMCVCTPREKRSVWVGGGCVGAHLEQRGVCGCLFV